VLILFLRNVPLNPLEAIKLDKLCFLLDPNLLFDFDKLVFQKGSSLIISLRFLADACPTSKVEFLSSFHSIGRKIFMLVCLLQTSSKSISGLCFYINGVAILE